MTRLACREGMGKDGILARQLRRKLGVRISEWQSLKLNESVHERIASTAAVTGTACVLLGTAAAPVGGSRAAVVAAVVEAGSRAHVHPAHASGLQLALRSWARSPHSGGFSPIRLYGNGGLAIKPQLGAISLLVQPQRSLASQPERSGVAVAFVTPHPL